MPFDGLTPLIARLRSEFPELKERSDFVVHTAAITMSALSFQTIPEKTTPTFVGADVGAGKTTGAILGIEKMFKETGTRSVLLTPYIAHAEALYRDLADRVGHANVCVWTSKHDIDSADTSYSQKFAKSEVAEYPIAIICHQAVSDPSHAWFLGERDLWVYDEEPANIRFSSVSLADIAAAFEWVNNIGEIDKIAATRAALDWATITHDNIKNNYEEIETLPWITKIAAWDLLDYRHTEPSATAEINEFVQFCRAVLRGNAFVNCESYGTSKVVSFNGIFCELPDPENTVVLSASAWIGGYKIAEEKYSDDCDPYLPTATYPGLKLVHLDKPDELPTYYKTYQANRSVKDKIKSYLEDLIAGIPENNIFLTCPKAVLEIVETCNFAPKTVHLSHHGVGTGSNDWRDCEAVVYFLDDHKPGKAHVGRKHAIVGDPVTSEALKDAQNYLRGPYAEIRTGHYLANMMQLIGRGRVRQRDNDGIPLGMKAYMIVDKRWFDMMPDLFPGCSTEYRSKPIARGRVIHRFADWLRNVEVRKRIQVSDVGAALGVQHKKYYKQLAADSNGVISGAGYKFVNGSRGRYGNPAVFETL